MTAAKQGFSAQWSQAQEDAKRAIYTRGGTAKHNLNVNTTCTIKSAPPRSPEILESLAIKAGLLYKRNEQHVWQARWCCVVPHMFLYYFERPDLPAISSEVQNEWNERLKQQDPHNSRGPRSSMMLPFGAAQQIAAEDEGGQTQHNTATTATATTPDSSKHLLPTGIIDLECYSKCQNPPSSTTTISTESDMTTTTTTSSSSNSSPTTTAHHHHHRLLELSSGDDPDLRHFYFSVPPDESPDDWSNALLQHRHSTLAEERDAYLEVCNGFSSQLQTLHSQCDAYEKRLTGKEEDLYRLRSAHEEVRRSCFSRMREALEGDTTTTTTTSTAEERRAAQDSLDSVRQQDLGLTSAVQVLVEYIHCVETTCRSLEDSLRNRREEQSLEGQNVTRLQQLIEAEQEARRQDQLRHQEALQQKDATIQSYKKKLKDCQNAFESKSMEIHMHSSKMKNKVTELTQHKKILKKEVIDLRQRLDEVGSELSLLKHHSVSSKLEVQQERKRTELLERYVEKMESQVKVQQNMMEILSQRGTPTSVYAGVGSSGGDAHSARMSAAAMSFSCGVANTPPTSHHREQRREVIDDNHHKSSNNSVLNDTNNTNKEETHSVLLRKAMADDVDNKSHMSELTEDRTHKQLFSSHGLPSPLNLSSCTPRSLLPPTYVAVNNNNNNNSSSNNSRNSNTCNNNSANNNNNTNDTNNNADDDDDDHDVDDDMDDHEPPTTRHYSSSSFSTPNKKKNKKKSTIISSSNNSSSSSSKKNKKKKDTIDRIDIHHAKKTTPQQQRYTTTTNTSFSSSQSLYSATSSNTKLSVAQRARLEADLPSNQKPRRSRTRSTSINDENKKYNELPSLLGDDDSSQTSGPSLLSNMAQSISNSGFFPAGVKSSSNNNNNTTTPNNSDAVSCTPSTLSLSERKAMQRAKQIAFLKQQGLLQSSSDSSSRSRSSSSSEASS